MPDLAGRIVVNRNDGTVTIDGVEFPWFIQEGGPQISNLDRDSLPVVTVGILCDNVQIINADWGK